MAGLDFVLLAAFVWWCDGLGCQRIVKPLAIMGRNAIAVYMVSELLAETLNTLALRGWLFHNLFARVASPINASLCYAVAYTLLMYLVAYGMYRREWFWRV